MKFKAKGIMRSKPSFQSRINMNPLAFDTSASGAFEVGVSSISATIGEIPIRFAIPFMRPRHKPPLVATVGAFRIKLNPLKVKIKGLSLQVGGVIGTKGVQAEMDTDVVACETEMEVEGKVPLKFGGIKMDLCEVDEL